MYVLNISIIKIYVAYLEFYINTILKSISFDSTLFIVLTHI